MADKSDGPVGSPWFSPAGKKQLAKKLVAMIPEHSTYVEPFAGSAAVFFAKPKVAREVLNDADPRITQALRDIKSLSQSELDTLGKRDWTGNADLYKKILKSTPGDRVARIHKFIYVSVFSYGRKWGQGFAGDAIGKTTSMPTRLPAARKRLQGVTVRSSSYQPVLSEFNKRDAFIFLDPPYVGTDVGVGESKFDETEFRKILQGVKGRFLLTYGTKGQLDVNGFRVRKIRPPRGIRQMRGASMHKTLPTLIVSNYEIIGKSLCGPDELDWDFEDAQHFVSLEGETVAASLVPDPSFVFARKSMGHQAATLSSVPLNAHVGVDRVLLNERVRLEDPFFGFGVVRLGDPMRVDSVKSLTGEMRDSIPAETLREFELREAAGESGFYFHPYTLVKAWQRPRDMLIAGLRPETHDIIFPDVDETRDDDDDTSKDDAKKKSDDGSSLIKLLKAEEGGEERFIMGVVLEPEVEDSQGDIYDVAEVRAAAHKFMEDARRIGLMHKQMLGQGAAILENFLAPVNFKIGGQKVKKGTWLMGIRVIDDKVWSAVKSGELTGLSIGGSALRVPEKR